MAPREPARTGVDAHAPPTPLLRADNAAHDDDDDDDDAHDDDPAFRHGAQLLSQALEVAVGGDAASAELQGAEQRGADGHTAHQVAYARAMARVAARTMVRGARKAKRVRTVATRTSDVAVAVGEAAHVQQHAHNSSSSRVSAAPSPPQERPTSSVLPRVPAWVHGAASSLMWAYVAGDVAWSVLQVTLRAEREGVTPPPSRGELAAVAAQQAVFHGFATVVIPDWVIGRAAAAGRFAADRLVCPIRYPRLFRWAPVLSALAAVPVLPTVIDTPVELVTGAVFDVACRAVWSRSLLAAEAEAAEHG